MTAHLDTVFSRGTNVKVRREGYVLAAPASATIAAGWPSMLAVARAMNKAGVSTSGTGPRRNGR